MSAKTRLLTAFVLSTLFIGCTGAQTESEPEPLEDMFFAGELNTRRISDIIAFDEDCEVSMTLMPDADDGDWATHLSIDGELTLFPQFPNPVELDPISEFVEGVRFNDPRLSYTFEIELDESMNLPAAFDAVDSVTVVVNGMMIGEKLTIDISIRFPGSNSSMWVGGVDLSQIIFT